VAKTHSLGEATHLAKGVLMGYLSSSSKVRFLAINSRSLRRDLEMKVGRNEEMFRLKDRMF
jgi:hypothetical protein